MADLSDVSNALKSAIVAAVYPNGIGAPSAVLDATGNPVDVKVGRGWPLKDTMGGVAGDTSRPGDLALGIVNITITAPPGMGRNTTRFPKDWQALTGANPTLTTTIAGNTVTIGGTISTPQNIAVVVNGIAFVYAVQAADTLASIAAELALLIPDATAAGPVITISDASGLVSATGGAGVQWREVRRQERVFCVSIWCNSPVQRDAVAPFVDDVFADVEFITLPDGTAGRILGVGTVDFDGGLLETLYRRDLSFTVEYPTIQIAPAYQIVAVDMALIGGQNPHDPATPSRYFDV